MSNHYPGSDDATQPLGSPPQNYPGQQGKLVLGGYGSSNQQAPRRPYQYPGQPAHAPITPPGQSYGQQRVATPPPFQPSAQPGQIVGGPARRPKGRRRRKGCMIGCLGMLAILVVLGVFLSITIPRVLAFGHAITPPGTDPLATKTNFMNTSERTNLLIMGYGGGKHDGANLTDSLVVTSMIPSTSHTSLVSVPR